jgi:4-hydroxy-2-oxoheptanedioate aldolase
METFLREAGRQGPAVGLWSGIGNSLVTQAMAATGADYVCVDLQHGTATEASLVPLIQAIVAGGSIPIVRVPEGNPAAIMKALDAGARGVVVPLVESGEQAARAVAACRYPPKGNRSFGPFAASIQAGTSDPRELEQVALIVMVETRAGIDHLDEIVATEGLTAVYLGPSDLSLAIGLPPGSIEAPEFVSLVQLIRAVCDAHGVVPGMHCLNSKAALRAIAQGFRMITVTGDMGTLRAALQSEVNTVRAALPATSR